MYLSHYSKYQITHPNKKRSGFLQTYLSALTLYELLSSICTNCTTIPTSSISSNRSNSASTSLYATLLLSSSVCPIYANSFAGWTCKASAISSSRGIVIDRLSFSISDMSRSPICHSSSCKASLLTGPG